MNTIFYRYWCILCVRIQFQTLTANVWHVPCIHKSFFILQIVAYIYVKQVKKNVKFDYVVW
jgi:hypothetical protein